MSLARDDRPRRSANRAVRSRCDPRASGRASGAPSRRAAPGVRASHASTGRRTASACTSRTSIRSPSQPPARQVRQQVDALDRERDRDALPARATSTSSCGGSCSASASATATCTSRTGPCATPTVAKHGSPRCTTTSARGSTIPNAPLALAIAAKAFERIDRDVLRDRSRTRRDPGESARSTLADETSPRCATRGRRSKGRYLTRARPALGSAFRAGPADERSLTRTVRYALSSRISGGYLRRAARGRGSRCRCGARARRRLARAA